MVQMTTRNSLVNKEKLVALGKTSSIFLFKKLWPWLLYRLTISFMIILFDPDLRSWYIPRDGWLLRKFVATESLQPWQICRKHEPYSKHQAIWEGLPSKHCYAEDILKTCLEDVLKTLWRQAKYLLGISVSNKSKCVSSKSIFNKSTFDNSKANPKSIK